MHFLYQGDTFYQDFSSSSWRFWSFQMKANVYIFPDRDSSLYLIWQMGFSPTLFFPKVNNQVLFFDRSRHDRPKETLRKIQNYLAAGQWSFRQCVES